MNFAFDADQVMLRDSVVRLLRDRVDPGRLAARGVRFDAPYDPGLWREMCELGWSGIVVPERFGGLGLGLVEWIVICEEIGRALAPCPYFGNYLGTLALSAAGAEAQQHRLFPAMIDGSARLALAWSEHESAEDPLCVRSVVAGDTLRGTKRYVIDADAATHFIVTARDPSQALGLYLVEREQGGVAVEALPWMDITRRVGTVRFEGAICEPLPVAFDAAWPWINDRALLALAAENAGGAEAVLLRSVAYAKERVQFGKPIAAYQAIKHRCADMLMQVESAKALGCYAAWALEHSAPEGPAAAAMAKSYSADAYRHCTSEAIQIHGAIGFTWELPIHLYYKRARANAVQFGNPTRLRDRVIELVTAA